MTYITAMEERPGIILELVCKLKACRTTVTCSNNPLAVAGAILEFSDVVGVDVDKINVKVVGELLRH